MVAKFTALTYELPLSCHLVLEFPRNSGILVVNGRSKLRGLLGRPKSTRQFACWEGAVLSIGAIPETCLLVALERK